MLVRLFFCAGLGVALLSSAAIAAPSPAADRQTCEKGDRDEALSACTRAINSGRYKGGELADLYSSRGTVHGLLGDDEAAIVDYTEALQLDPKLADAYQGRCLSYVVLDQLQTALSDCNEALRLKPKDFQILGSRGIVLLRLNLLDSAIADFDSALKIDRKYAGGLYGRGIARLRKGDTRGKADIAAAVAIRPGVVADWKAFKITPPGPADKITPPGTAEQPGAPPSPSTAKGKSLQPTTPDCSAAETHWKSVLTLDVIEGYEDHLQRFPTCTFATLAKVRIETLRKKQ